MTKQTKAMTVKQEVKKIETIIVEAKDILKKASIMTPSIKKQIEALGFDSITSLGTGQSARITSKQVCFMDIKSRSYLNGTYLVIGSASHGYSAGGNLYKGLTLEISREAYEELR